MAEESKKDRLINTVIGKCLLVKRIGKGGMGDVYLGHHQFLQKKVAVKVLPADFTRSAEFVARFHREAIAAAKLEHNNIVQVHDIGEEHDVYYIVMSYVEGKTLQEILDERKDPMDPIEAARICAEIAKGLKCAHEQGIVHRDIKPSNIMVSDKGDVKIMDFGLAFDADSGTQLTRAGAIMGTPHFISPEQADGKRADERSDLYSLGVVFYYMATGMKPFTGESTMAILYKHLNQMPEPPSKVNPKIPSHLAAMIVKLLAKKPENRYANAGELIADIESFVANPIRRPSGVHATASPVPRKSASIRALDPEKAKEAGALRRVKPTTDPNIKRSKMPLFIAGGVLGLTVVAVLLAILFGGKKEEPGKPDGGSTSQKPPNRDLYSEYLQKGLEREVSEKYDEALGFFKQALQQKDTPEVRKAIERVEAHILKQIEDELWKVALEANTVKAFEDYLARFPQGPHAAEAQVRIEKLKDDWTLESDFTLILNEAAKMRICNDHMDSALKFEEKQIFIDTSRTGSNLPHFLWQDGYDVRNFVFRGEIYLERGRPAIVGRYVLTNLAEPGREKSPLWEFENIPSFTWVKFELVVTGDDATLTLDTRKSPLRSLSGLSRYGAVGFRFTGDDRLRLRRLRLKVTERVNLDEIRKAIEAEKKKNLSNHEVETVQEAVGPAEKALLRKRTPDPVRKKLEAMRVDLKTDRGIREWEHAIQRIAACEKVIAGFFDHCRAQQNKTIELRTKSGVRKGAVTKVGADHVMLGTFQVPLQEVLAEEMVALAGGVRLLDQVMFLLVEGAAKPLLDRMIVQGEILAGAETWVGELVDVVVAEVEACVRERRTKDAEALLAQARKIEAKLGEEDRQKLKGAEDSLGAAKWAQAWKDAQDLLKKDRPKGRDALLKIVRDPTSGSVASDAAKDLYTSVLEHDPWVSGFNGRDLNGWKVDPSKDVKAEQGEILVNSTSASLAPPWMKSIKGVAAHVYLEEDRGGDGVGFAWAYKDRDNHRSVLLTKAAASAIAMESGKPRALGARVEAPTGKWMHVVALEMADVFLVYVNGELLYRGDAKTDSISSGSFLVLHSSAKLKDLRYRR